MAYDSTNDTKKHIAFVARLLDDMATAICARGIHHDESKLQSPEKEMYDAYRPRLDALDIQGAEYKEALKEMGNALQHHYQENRHHPEHFENGINGMTLIDLIEMVCDWSAAAKRKDPNGKINTQWARDRFGIDDQLASIIENTAKLIE